MATDFLGKGLGFPLGFERRSGGARVSSATTTEHEHIHESIIQILGTSPGERFMRPEFGSRLRSLVFEANDEVLKGLIRHHIVEAIKRWDKRVIVTAVTFDQSPEEIDRHVLPVRISYRVIQTQVEGNLVYPFHREPFQGPAARQITVAADR